MQSGSQGRYRPALEEIDGFEPSVSPWKGRAKRKKKKRRRCWILHTGGIAKPRTTDRPRGRRKADSNSRSAAPGELVFRRQGGDGGRTPRFSPAS